MAILVVGDLNDYSPFGTSSTEVPLEMPKFMWG